MIMKLLIIGKSFLVKINMTKIALIIIYNHQFNSNIEKLEKIYGDKFSKIFHLVPFYKGTKSNVIPVFDNSFYFSGYIAQGLKSFFNKDYSHYFFIADDMILNPKINESNYEEYLGVDGNSSFFPEFISLDQRTEFWPRAIEALNYNLKQSGIEITKMLPHINEISKIFQSYNLSSNNLNFNLIYQKPNISKNFSANFVYTLRKLRNKIFPKLYKTNFPIAGGYSDILLVDSNSIVDFCHFCGIFASTRLFVELAIPTALLISAKKIVTEKNISLKGKALWTNEELKYLDKFNFNLELLYSEFPSNQLYLHPIKLSKWQ